MIIVCSNCVNCSPIDCGATRWANPALNSVRHTGKEIQAAYWANGCPCKSLNNQILAQLHNEIPLSIMKLRMAMMTPSRAKNTQSSPRRANVCFHRNDTALASLPTRRIVTKGRKLERGGCTLVSSQLLLASFFFLQSSFLGLSQTFQFGEFPQLPTVSAIHLLKKHVCLYSNRSEKRSVGTCPDAFNLRVSRIN